MFAVHFFENNTILLTQLLRQVPSVGEELTIKGRKGKVSNVNSIDEKNVHVHLIIEKVNKNNKNKPLLDNSKKKKK